MFHPGKLWPDNNGVHINAHGGGVLFHEGAYYWFGEHKIEGEAGNFAHVGVHVYSSRDLYRWTDEGVALAVSGDAGSLIERGCKIERPKVIRCERGGAHKFVMWFHLEPKAVGYSGALSGVAVAERVTGPYRFLHALRPNAGVWPLNVAEKDKRALSPDEAARLDALQLGGAPFPWYPKNLVYRRDFAGGQMARDMTLFADDNGEAYHIYTSENNGTLHISRLDADCTRPVGRFARVLPGRFHEAPALMKHGGRYFLFSSDCTGWAPNTARLSVAENIFGPWEELGNPCIGTGAQLANTFESQPTHILPVAGKTGAFIYMGDRWRPKNAIDGRYVWLPVEFRHGVPTIAWRDAWDLSAFSS